MSDLTPAQWREVEKAAVYFEGERNSLGRYIGLGVLRNIIRKSRRSNDQNALLWALYDDVLRMGGESLGGWTRADLHEWALGEHFGWVKSTAFGMTRMKPNRRSSRLTKTEFTDFLDGFVRRMAEHGIVLTLPGDLSPGSGSEAGPGARNVQPRPQVPVAAAG